jgi:branched-chain amino acid transport system substrate-binding protein
MQNQLKWVVAIALITALVAVGGMSCTSEEEEAETYKVGAAFDLTGPTSHLGEPEEQTVKMIVAEINAGGGINGHPLEVIIYNTEGDAEKCATMVNRLIEQDEVLAIIGPTRSGSSLAIIDTVTAAEIPNVSCAASIQIVEPVNERYWVFKTPQTDKQAVTEIYIYLEAQGITEIAIISDTSGFGVGGRNILLADAVDYGITILDDQTFDNDDTSMQSQLTHIKGTAPEAVICWSTDKESAIVAVDMQTLQMDTPLFCSHGIANMGFITGAGDAANGVIFPAGKLLIRSSTTFQPAILRRKS